MNSQNISSLEVVYRWLLDKYPMEHHTLNIVKAIITGSMSASAVASPILFELKRVWLVDNAIFFFSWMVFMLQHRQELKTYGPFTLALATFLGIAAYSSSQTSLPDLAPWLPFSVLLFILLTVYFLPIVHDSLDRPDDFQETAEAMEEGRPTAVRRLSMEQTSVQSNEGGYRIESIAIRQWRDQTLAGINHRSAASSSGDTSLHDSDIDLNENVELVNIFPRVITGIHGLPESTPNSEWLQDFQNYGPSTNFHGPRELYTRSQSPQDSVIVNQSGESEASLL